MVTDTVPEAATPGKAYIYNGMVLIAKFINTCLFGDSSYGLGIIQPMPIICYSHSGDILPQSYVNVNDNLTEPMVYIPSPMVKP